MYSILVSTFVSLVIALTSVSFSHYLAQKIKFKSNLKGVVTEIQHNISILDDVMSIINNDNILTKKEGKITSLPLLKLDTFAFDYFVLEGHLMSLSEEDRHILEEIYALFKIINECIERYEETKYGVLYFSMAGKNIREGISVFIGDLISKVKSLAEEFIQRHINKKLNF